MLTEEEKRLKRNQKERERYNRNKEKICKKLRERYANDEEYKNKILEKNALYKKENPEVMPAWRATHKVEIAAYNKEYANTPRGRANSLLGSYRTNDKMHNRGECTITADWIIENIFNAGICTYCKREFDWTELGCDRKDNSLPHTPENCVPCCLSCNSQKGNMSYDEYMKKVRTQS